jgi:hypothetical protein
MARSVAKLKMGFYPLPESEGAKLRQLLSFTGPASVVDPCVGQGTRAARPSIHIRYGNWWAGSTVWKYWRQIAPY